VELEFNSGWDFDVLSPPFISFRFIAYEFGDSFLIVSVSEEFLIGEGPGQEGFNFFVFLGGDLFVDIPHGGLDIVATGSGRGKEKVFDSSIR
jgi:hypothetical protein